MFERVSERAMMLATQRAKARIAALAERIAAQLPHGISVRAEADGAAIEGRDVARRFASDAGLRWILERIR